MKTQLGKKFIVEQVYKEHIHNWLERRKMKFPDMCDNCVQLKDIIYYESILNMGLSHYHYNDFDSMKMWALDHPDDVFI